MTSSDQGPSDRPRSEPEIIPPERGDRRHDGRFRDGRSHVWVWVADREGMRQSNVALPGPFTIFLALALIALVVGGILVLALGAVLIWIPIFVLSVGALLIAAAARQYWWRFRRWLSQP